MSYRPYPDRERALSQLDRHQPAPPAREPSEFERQLAFSVTTALEGMGRAIRPMVEGMLAADVRKSS